MLGTISGDNLSLFHYLRDSKMLPSGTILPEQTFVAHQSYLVVWHSAPTYICVNAKPQSDNCMYKCLLLSISSQQSYVPICKLSD